MSYSIQNKHTHTPHILDNNTYKGHTHSDRHFNSAQTHSTHIDTFDRLCISVITGSYDTQLLESRDCMFLDMFRGKKEALWFDETAASITRFTVTTACTGFSLVQSYSGVKLTKESAEGSGVLRWAAPLRCTEAGGHSSRERRKKEGRRKKPRVWSSLEKFTLTTVSIGVLFLQIHIWEQIKSLEGWERHSRIEEKFQVGRLCVIEGCGSCTTLGQRFLLVVSTRSVLEGAGNDGER